MHFHKFQCRVYGIFHTVIVFIVRENLAPPKYIQWYMYTVPYDTLMSKLKDFSRVWMYMDTHDNYLLVDTCMKYRTQIFKVLFRISKLLKTFFSSCIAFYTTDCWHTTLSERRVCLRFLDVFLSFRWWIQPEQRPLWCTKTAQRIRHRLPMGSRMMAQI